MSANADTGASAPCDAVRWSDDLLLGHAEMDDCHRAFVRQLEQLQLAGDARLESLLDQFIEHLQAHFAHEEQMMRDTDFPPRQCHMDEHAAVMRSVCEVRYRLADGDRQLVRALARALADWFPAHTHHLDSALAHWVNKRRLGGKPIVLKRNLGLSA